MDINILASVRKIMFPCIDHGFRETKNLDECTSCLPGEHNFLEDYPNWAPSLLPSSWKTFKPEISFNCPWKFSERTKRLESFQREPSVLKIFREKQAFWKFFGITRYFRINLVRRVWIQIQQHRTRLLEMEREKSFAN